MGKYRYILEPYKGMNTRYPCPSCKHREFARYIDTEIGQYVNAKVGRCNRQDNCGYHYTPKQYFKDNNISFEGTHPYRVRQYQPKAVTPQRKPVSFIPVEVFKDSLDNHQPNHFIKFLLDLFGVEVTGQLISRYFIGTSTQWDGATVFWQIDIKGRVRTGKIMLYNPLTGKRVKQPHNYITWVHSTLKQPEFELRQCLFGEHLLRDKVTPVAIVESEKTAIIASVYFPGLTWLAVGSLNNLNAEKCAVLAGRKVVLFPDINGFEKWNSTAKKLSHLAAFSVSALLENRAGEAEHIKGYDLADYLIQFNYRDFATPPPAPAPTLQPPAVQLTGDISETPSLVEVLNPAPAEWGGKWLKADKPQRGDWQQEITELEQFFNSAPLPTEPVQLTPEGTITDITQFIETHLSFVKANNGKAVYLPYLERLQELKQYLTINLN